MCYQKLIPDIVSPSIYLLPIQPEFIPAPPGVIQITDEMRERIWNQRKNRPNATQDSN